LIREVNIRGYQSHVQTTIKFHPHLNVIVGPSNAGKSVILRALKKVIRDLPAGNNFINKDTDTCEVVVDNGFFQIKRRIVKNDKGTTKINEYYINDDQRFSSFNREIPQEVVTALNMPIVNFGGDLELDLHFAGQHDGNFLLDETASVQSKILGRVSGLNVIDEAIQKVKTETRRVVNSCKNVGLDIEQLNSELQKLPNVDVLNEQVDFFETKLQELEKKYKKLEKLQDLERKIFDLIQQGNKLKNEVEALPNLDNLNFDDVKTKINILTRRKELLNGVNDLNSRINTLETDPIYSLTISLDSIEHTKTKITRLIKLKQLETFLVQHSNSITQIENELKKVSVDYTQVTQEWKLLLQKLGICPTCKQPTQNVKFEE